jgi:serine/threonine protein kinase
MPLAAGEPLGPYEILGRIGAGGMGEVYRACDPKLGRDIALKILPPAFASDADRMARIRREAQVLAALNHPHIAAIYGLQDSGPVTVLVMELVDGPKLDSASPRMRRWKKRYPSRARSPKPWSPRTRRASSIAISSLP